MKLPVTPLARDACTPPALPPEVVHPDVPSTRRGSGVRRKVLMVYPKQGFSGVFIKHMPLSLLYASAGLVKQGVDVEILDARLFPETWREELQKRISAETLVVGVSVMSGTPIKNAVEISRFVKSIDPAIHTVWGGPHATFAPDSIMDEPAADFVVSGYGNVPFTQLVNAMLEGRADDYGTIPGLSFRKAGRVVKVPENKEWERIPYKEIPYHLLTDMTPYGQLDSGRTIFSMYSVVGCPYQCTFCSSPAQYRGIPGKAWVPFDVEEVVGHISYVVEKYGADYIYFIDDDSFPKLSHVEGIIDEIKRRGLKVKLGFRGARINEIKRMSHAYLTKLAEAGTDMMHIGAESGSDRILELIKKDCTVEDILECNRKLAQHPEITVGYNFMMGLPSETMDEVRKTRDLMLKLVEDNPRAVIFTPNKFRPLPQTELFDWSVKEWGYAPPKTLEEWSNIELEADYSFGWYPEGMEQFTRMMLVTSYFVDDKIFKFSRGKTPFYKVLRAMSAAYAPLARYRLRHGEDRLLLEYPFFKVAQDTLVKLRADNALGWRIARKLLAPDEKVSAAPTAD